MATDLHQLTVLADDLFAAKAAEERMRAARIAVEERIAALIPGPERGQETVTLEDGRKIKVERGFNYRADFDALQELQEIGAIDFAPIKLKTTRELDEKGYEWFRKHDPDSFSLLRSYVTTTPKKVSVSLKAQK